MSGSRPGCRYACCGRSAARPQASNKLQETKLQETKLQETKLQETKLQETKLQENRQPAAGIDNPVGSRRRAKRDWWIRQPSQIAP